MNKASQKHLENVALLLQELCSAFEAKEVLYQELLNKGQQLLAVTPAGPDSNAEQDLANLKDKWEAVQGKVTERKVRQSWWWVSERCSLVLLLA